MHPGGKKALANYINKDITEILFKIYPHKREHTLKILQRYAVGEIREKTPAKKTI
jgi:cytochrome b involved in lipid metabolism